MTSRAPLVAANWKMNMTVGESGGYFDRFLPPAAALHDVELWVCPSFTSLASAAERCRGSGVRVAAQNMHFAEAGAFTGEVSAPMLVELGVDGVILGHSERRRHFAETDEALARKVPAALGAGLVPILCVGESEGQRDAGETMDVLRRQLEADLAKVPSEDAARLVVAYEPVWAIGTGRNATVEQATEAIAFIRSVLAELEGRKADAIRILYGGSVSAGNAAELLRPEEVDGALVGGASLDPDVFLEIAAAARS